MERKCSISVATRSQTSLLGLSVVKCVTLSPPPPAPAPEPKEAGRMNPLGSRSEKAESVSFSHV